MEKCLINDCWFNLTVETSDKTTEGCLRVTKFFITGRVSVNDRKVFHKVDVHLDEEGLEYRKPKSCARLKQYKSYYHVSHAWQFSLSSLKTIFQWLSKWHSFDWLVIFEKGPDASDYGLWKILQLLVWFKFTKNIFVANNRYTIVWRLVLGEGFRTCPKI